MLYVCGKINSVGRVDDGDTVMDFLPQERERGITISSAAK
jgi:elongation factor G